MKTRNTPADPQGHAQRAHALLSCSSAARWIACPPSARLEAEMPDVESEYAKEGTLAHEFCEQMLLCHTGRITGAEYSDRAAALRKNHFYAVEMTAHCQHYADYVMEVYNQERALTPDAELRIEQRLDLTEYIPEGFGTADAVIIADDRLTVIDFKYGKGVPVSATNNAQMKCYALGALQEASLLFDIKEVRMVIVQPRLQSISESDISATCLREWGESLKLHARQAFQGEGEFKAGEHCRFCKIAGQCRHLADVNLEIARHEFKDPPLLSDDDVVDILHRAPAFKTWIDAVHAFAFNQALGGKRYEGWKLVEGRTVRQYSDQDAVLRTLREAGYDEAVLTNRSLLTITQMEKLLGKETFNELLSGWVVKPEGKPVLAPASDKRPEYNSAETAAADFAEPIEENEK